ncbi:MAG: zinc-ribbon and DUF3426 domain-containing protein [Ideonella sp.]
MTLATRCISCGTTFRVVQDQLRVSDGWVRCGRCDTVFDALASLIDLDPSAADTATRPAREPRAGASAMTESAPIDIQRLLERQDLEAGESAVVGGDSADKADALASQMAYPEGLLIETPDSAQASQPTTIAEGAAAADSRGDGARASKAADHTDRPAPPAITPTFMRDAQRQERSNSPATRAALLGTSLILLIMLMLQVVYHQRDSIASRSPAASTLLRSACARWNCTIEPLRRIGDLSIESSALAKVAGKPESVRLTISLRNRGVSQLSMPAIELNLTDAQGKLLARKALLPQDFHVDPPVVEAAAALPLQLVLSTGEARVAGYTVELFYPLAAEFTVPTP